MDDNREQIQLYEFILANYTLMNDVEELCFYLNVRIDDLSGQTRPAKVRSLVQHLADRDRLIDLRAILLQQREDAYRSRFGAAAAPVIVAKRAPRRGERKPDRNPKQIFVSHDTDDAVFAHRLADDLRRQGYAIWIAPESIPPGQWVSAINRGLAESGVMVLVLSPAAMASPWVEMETNVAIELERAGEMRFIPVCLVPDRYDPVWHAYQWVMFNHDYDAAMRELLARLDGSAAPPRPRPSRRIHEKTGIELIRIPAGPFLYGSSNVDTMARDNEKPQRTIDLPEYWIGRYPVTNARFARFVQAKGYRTTAEQQGSGWAWTGGKWDEVKGADWRHPRGPESSIDGKDEHPVVQVSWDDAKAFCDWAGLALPTEEQWEKAARGTDGLVWPWSNDPPTDKHCNCNGNVGDTTPVGRYSPLGDSPYSCADMAGNVWEWTGSWYAEGATRALRGGSWHSDVRDSRAAYRLNLFPVYWNFNVGFRVAELLSDPGF